jgi:hypothetical protein
LYGSTGIVLHLKVQHNLFSDLSWQSHLVETIKIAAFFVSTVSLVLWNFEGRHGYLEIKD